ncbi:hypothetical protein ACROYT_G020892 [Oculina patagonica]
MLPMLDDIVYSSKKSITLKRTSTQRSDSSASESSSPSDKRLRNTKHIELEGEVQEVFEGAVEASLAVDMSEMMAEKLDEILAKLNKLDSIETTLNNLCSKMATVESDVSKLKDGARVTDGKLEKMDNGLQWMNTEVEDLKLKITLLETAKKDLHTQQLYAEAYSRRENLKFFGLAERETKSSSNSSEVINTRNILFEFLEKRLGLENPEKEIELQRVHRIGKPTAGKTRPIIARFLRFQDREMVLKASFRLQDPEIKVLEDYPQEIIERRRKQMKKLKDAKKNGGDFNCPLNPTLDKRGGIMIPRKSVVSSIECLQNELDLIDIWRVQNPQTKSFTWSQNSPTVLCRLDFWLISNNLCDFVNSTDIIPAIRTDHAAISLILGKVGEVKGPGMWKMNVTLLDDEEYLNYLSVNIPKWKSEGEKELSNKRSVWDWIKYNIRKHNIKYSKDKAKQRIDKERIIQQEYKEATRQFENDPSDLNRCCLNEIKEKLELLYEEKTKGIIVRARARWHEHGERSTKYFLNLEKRNHVKKHIRKLLISGAITTDPYRILTEQKNFYHNLYKTSSTDTDSIKSFLDNLNIPQLSEDQKQSCEGQITIDECKRILETFQNNKSPGNDGIPIEFYKSCWNLICEPFINCVNESFENEEMSNSQKQAVITLIEKQGKDRTLMENWRPISLVNVDAKIISKVIASRLKEVLPHIIHCNQTGYVKDRYIGETVRSILDIMDFTERENIPGLLIFIDFRKAFDTLEWNFLFKCLDAFNFGPEFKRWISTFYKNIQSCVINNGMSSEYFNLTRGVRQGDPLSPYLFLLAVESLAIAVRENEEIKGIAIERQETKLLQYADDTTAVLSDIESAHKLFQLLDKFRKLSGLKVNSSKTEGLWLGSLKGNEMKPLGIKWPQDPIKALGIFFTYDKKLLFLKNFSEKLDKIKKLINIWSSRGLSLYGKRTIEVVV